MKSIFFIESPPPPPPPSGAKLLILNYFLGAPIRCFTVADGLYKERISE